MIDIEPSTVHFFEPKITLLMYNNKQTRIFFEKIYLIECQNGNRSWNLPDLYIGIGITDSSHPTTLDIEQY